MSIRQTSIDIYRQIESEGLLSKRRFEVYKVLFDHGPLTATETARRIPNVMDHSISPRFAELLKHGVVREAGLRKCPVTGRNCIVWAVTNRLPIRFEKSKKVKCPHCKGKGFFHESQGVFL